MTADRDRLDDLTDAEPPLRAGISCQIGFSPRLRFFPHGDDSVPYLTLQIPYLAMWRAGGLGKPQTAMRVQPVTPKLTSQQHKTYADRPSA